MTDKEKIPVLAVVGPTASGKTALGVDLAEHFGGEVVSADSMQIYKGMSVATAKPTEDEMKGIPHHLIDFLDIAEPFSVADYVKLAGETIKDIRSRNRLPVLVGGTGLYVSSLLDNLNFTDQQSDHKLRDELSDFAKENGAEALHSRLKELDPESAKSIHPNNIVRVIRAIEVCTVTGEKFSTYREKARSADSPYNSCILGLDFEDRDYLYERINARVDIMVQNGLADEAYEVWKNGDLATAGNAIGYKELVPYFEGTASLDECIDEIKLQTRHYAKRQLTWFRRNKQIMWIILDKSDDLKKIHEKSLKAIVKSKIL